MFFCTAIATLFGDIWYTIIVNTEYISEDFNQPSKERVRNQKYFFSQQIPNVITC